MTKPKKRMRIVPFRHPYDSTLVFWQLEVDAGRGKRGSRLGIYRSCAAAMDRAVTGKKRGASRGWTEPAVRFPDGSGRSEMHVFPKKRPPYPEH